MSNPLYKINNLVCSYKKGKDVLSIRKLEIPRNRIIVLIGKSGGGKSTFLETLGLMNDTIKSGEILFYPTPDAPPLSLKEQWAKSHRTGIAKIRRDYYSFIFQNTNLMQNFTAHENACLSQMIHGNSFDHSMERVRETMGTMGLGDVEEWKNASELSGGQRQRLAFVRAITTSFTVLFGDEPTGNLDEFNSDELMQKLQDSISNQDRSAIIVSHNIELSARYADMIMVLIKSDDKDACAYITPEQVFTRKGKTREWLDHAGRPVENIVLSIQSTLTGKTPATSFNP
ncbi:MAG TPA: ABC transporter ATP-binding protein [Bacteroidales bacterium]|nr:ABC transporter ATP-binding protein [Bacteroidales bacterium]HPS63336.1 ABC transporter ATP-binding protein [Bacteroidales bacterium]